MRGSRVPALLVGVAAALTLAGCGVPPSGVIQAGQPAGGMFSPGPESSAPTGIRLFFLRDGELTPYPRAIRTPGDFGPVVRLLFAGPTERESATASTDLPRLTEAPQVTVSGSNTVSVRLPSLASPLSRRAMMQLACTVSGTPYGPAATDTPRPTASRTPLVHMSVHVLGNGWTMTQSDASCPDYA
ncbi:hypothetical protein [Streptomyces sp. NPDC086787]|uniref:hypothetical protein n=1 Tax=Streptomyces sp. NPDC086787 TaxID=3365759 RepID=UPI003800CAD7